jgi:hypothetical protein
MAKFEGEHLVHLILTKLVFACKSFLSLRHGGLGDDLRLAVLAVLVSLHKNGNLWAIPRDPVPALASLAPKRKPASLRPLAPA